MGNPITLVVIVMCVLTRKNRGRFFFILEDDWWNFRESMTGRPKLLTYVFLLFVDNIYTLYLFTFPIKFKNITFKVYEKNTHPSPASMCIDLEDLMMFWGFNWFIISRNYLYCVKVPLKLFYFNQIGVAVGDIDKIQRKAYITRLSLQVRFYQYVKYLFLNFMIGI